MPPPPPPNPPNAPPPSSPPSPMPTLAPANSQKLQFSVPGTFAVDRAKGTLTGLSLITAGREAKGHGLYIDAETLATGAAVVAARGGRIKGAIRHGSYDELLATGMDRVLDFPGWFSAIAIKGEQLVAGLFEFYDTFKADNAKAYARLLEMAEKTPDLFGISIEVYGYAVYVATDGKEFGQRPEGVELQYDGLPALRITDLSYAAFVDEPAANTGLFAQLSAAFGGKQKSPAATAELVAALSAWAAKHNAPPLAANSNDPSITLSQHETATMKIIADLKAKFATEPKKFAAAMLHVGNNPSITLPEVEVALAAEEATALNGQVTALTAELGTVKTSLGTITAERDTLKGEVAKLTADLAAVKKSGTGGPVDLGATSAGAGQTTVNPWLSASLNYTDQVRLSKANPALAAQFKAAAQNQ